ncbi:MAG: hypothetical protein CMF59_01645 [Leptospiraceae bacterium]|nr:hypothetical protein [Leptospiraceae bacterium]
MKENFKALCDQCGPKLPGRGKLLHSISYYPKLLEAAFVAGYEHIPPVTEQAPIMCFSHKKIHDVMALAQYMIGRDVERFHNLTLVAQGGLFHGIFPYQDMMPGFVKNQLFKLPAGWSSRFIARYFRGLFEDLNAYPVYRDGSDLPITEEEYRHPSFAGPQVTGMSYADFHKYTRKQTAKSVLQVQRDMEEKNRSFVILPEGRYCHDGRISELLDLAAFASHRKSRPIVYTTLSYEELCPDALGKIEVFMYTTAAVAPPESRNDFKEHMKKGRTLLQNNTTVLASSILAAATFMELEKGPVVSRASLQQRYEELSLKLLESELIYDPRLQDEAFRKERWSRYISRKAFKWFSIRGDEMKVRPKRILKYDDGERTVPDLLWNINNAIHAAPVFGLNSDRVNPEIFRGLVEA